MQNKENYLYSVRIETEILANREQEYITVYQFSVPEDRRRSNNTSV